MKRFSPTREKDIKYLVTKLNIKIDCLPISTCSTPKFGAGCAVLWGSLLISFILPGRIPASLSTYIRLLAWDACLQQMSTRTPDSLATQHVGGRLAVALFAVTLIAAVAETQLAQASPARNCHYLASHSLHQQYVQTTLGYRQPFFILWVSYNISPKFLWTIRSYLVHSSFSIIFPLHLLYLLATTDYTAAALLKGLNIAITNHLSPGHKSTTEFPRAKFFCLVLGLTWGITCPGVLWFSAMSLAS